MSAAAQRVVFYACAPATQRPEAAAAVQVDARFRSTRAEFQEAFFRA